MVLTKAAVGKICEKMSSRLRKQQKDGKGGEQEEYNENTDCPVPYITCLCKGQPIPTSVDGPDSGIRMRCKNDRCQLAKILVHKKCFEHLQETLVKVLGQLGSARGWTDAQLRSNLWEKKGQTLIAKLLRCHCGLGLMSLDVDFYKKRELEEQEQQRQQQLLAKTAKKKCSKKSKLPALNFTNSGPVALELLQNDFVNMNINGIGTPRPAGRGGGGQLNGLMNVATNRFEHQQPDPVAVGRLQETVITKKFKQQDEHDWLGIRFAKSEEGKRRTEGGGGGASPTIQTPKAIPKQARLAGHLKPLRQRENDRPGQDQQHENEPKQRPLMAPSAAANAVNTKYMLIGSSAMMAVTPNRPDGQAERPNSSSSYSLFDPNSHSFRLGELLMGESRLPGLMPHTC